MATVSATERRKPTPVQERPETLADLLRRLGNIPANRVRLHPFPGTATEKDLIRNNESLFGTAICELVDGTLVEKHVGWEEGVVAGLIIQALLNFVRPRKLGKVMTSEGMLRLFPGLIRAPDVSFVAPGRLKRYKRGGERYPSIGADLAVEVLSKSNTKAEIARKLKEYFATGTRLAWIVDPKTETVRVHRAPEEFVVLKAGDILDGGDVIPGLRIPVQASSTWKTIESPKLSQFPMAQLTLFQQEDRLPQAARLRPQLRALAAQGIYFGTSSWKYDGWLGSIYTPGRYAVRGRFSQRKFEAECLAEYAETFPAVCGDFSFYQFPSPDYWQGLFGSVPAWFQFAFKVPEEITVAAWPGHARYGARAGQSNGSFLDAGLFERQFAGLLEPFQDRVATLIFEFGTIPRSVFATAGEFAGRLDAFLGALPGGYRYAVEVRNPEFLVPGYFATLARHSAAHVFNAWTRMPALAAQIEIPEAFTADFAVVRALLRRGRTYEQAVSRFSPYRAVGEPDTPTRDALVQIADRARQSGKPAYVFVNNRLEGNAPTTIEAVAEALGSGR